MVTPPRQSGNSLSHDSYGAQIISGRIILTMVILVVGIIGVVEDRNKA
jgi:hypothetical protein